MVNFLEISEPSYPALLRNIYQRPERLFFKGDVSVLNGNLIAVVGTRNFTPYGRMAVEKLIEDLSLCDVVIVSGLARGIDTLAHENALKFGLKTVAVLGTGIENVYPVENRDLAGRIVEAGGCILSEYEGEAPASKFSFPARNRIIAGLCLATLVVEAPESSGALITAKRANEEDREVFAVPGDIDRLESAGCNKLIQGLVAKSVSSGMDIIRELKIQPTLFTSAGRGAEAGAGSGAGGGAGGGGAGIGLGADVNKVLDAIPKTRPVSVDQIIEKTGLNSKDINKFLSLLEIHGLIIGTDNGFYLRTF